MYQYVCSIEWILCCLYVASIVSVSPLLGHALFHSHSIFLLPLILSWSLHFCLCSLYYCYAVFILSLPGRMPHEAALLRWSHEYYNHLYISFKVESVYSHSSLWYIYMPVYCVCWWKYMYIILHSHAIHAGGKRLHDFVCSKKKHFLKVSPVPYCISLLHVSWYLHCRVYFISIWFHVFQRNHLESQAIKYSKIKLA